ncbi:uncharacterized protein EV420DRAFT_1531672, partial [Desarmillaria tabescens]
MTWKNIRSGRTFFPYFLHVRLTSSHRASPPILRVLFIMNFYQPLRPPHPLNLPLFNTSVPKRVPLWRPQAMKTPKVTKLTNDPLKRMAPQLRKDRVETIASAFRRHRLAGAARTSKLPGCNPPLPDEEGNIPNTQKDNVDELVTSLDSTHLFILTAHRCQLAFEHNLTSEVMLQRMRKIEDHDAAASQARMKRRLAREKAEREEQRKKAEQKKRLEEEAKEAKRKQEERERRRRQEEQERRRKLKETQQGTSRSPPSKPTCEESSSVAFYRLYEFKWTILKSGDITSSGPPTFETFPWPCFETISREEDLTSEKIRTFLLDPARPNAKDKTKKDIIKEELLRWHPDKFVKVLPLMKEDDREKVGAAAKIVGRLITDLLPEFAR